MFHICKKDVYIHAVPQMQCSLRKTIHMHAFRKPKGYANKLARHESQAEAPPAYHPLLPQKAVNSHHPTLDCIPAIITSHGSHGKHLISKANSHLKCLRQDLLILIDHIKLSTSRWAIHVHNAHMLSPYSVISYLAI